MGRAFLILLSLLLLSQLAWATAEPRTALVIGNGAYASAPLKNARNDAADLAAKLRERGFEVLHYSDLDRKGMRRALRQFKRKLKQKGGVGLFFYSGHGLQLDGRNYLLPVGAEIEEAFEVEDEGLEGGAVLRAMEDAGNDINIVVLDACRNNPFASRFRSASRGLAVMGGGEGAKGSLIAFSTAPGDVAADGDGRNSPYTRALLKVLDEPGLELEEVFKRVRVQVVAGTGRKQWPWVNSSVLGRFYFYPPPGGVAPPPGATPPPPPPPVAATGHLQVNVTGAEAQVTVNGRAMGVAAPGRPLNLSNLPVGQAEVAVQAEGYQPQSKAVTIRAGQWSQPVFALEPAAPAGAVLVIRSNVTGDTAYIDGTAVGPTGPKEHGVAPGPHRIRVEREGFEPYEVELTLGAGQRRVVRARLARKGRGLAPEMVSIRGGCFQMGSPESEKGRDGDERQHRVCVEDFAIGRTEVTVGQWRRFIQATGYRTDAERDAGGDNWKGCWSLKDNKWGWVDGRDWKKVGFKQRDDYPVACVSWNDAQKYIEWLNRETGERYRLPTEAEWEYAARAGTTTARYWGDGVDGRACRYANVADEDTSEGVRWNTDARFPCDDGHNFAAPVGSKQPNPWGLHDMLGNVWEWTCSEYDKDYGGAERRCISNKHANATRSLRGGSWNNKPRRVRAANRNRNRPAKRNSNVGFRLASPPVGRGAATP